MSTKDLFLTMTYVWII